MTVFEKYKRWREITGNLEQERKEITERLNKATERAVDAASRGNKADYTTANFEREIAEGELRKLDAKAEPYALTCEEITCEWNAARAEHNKKLVKAAKELLKVRAAYMKAAENLCSIEEAARFSRADYIALARSCGVGAGKVDFQIADSCASVNWGKVYALTDHRSQDAFRVTVNYDAERFLVGELEDVLSGY